MNPSTALRTKSGEPAKVHFKSWFCWIEVGRYAAPNGWDKGPIALTLRELVPPPDETDLVAKATVNVDLADDHETAFLLMGDGSDYVLIKDWSENEGMLSALAAAGLINDTGERIPTGMCEAALCELLAVCPVAVF